MLTRQFDSAKTSPISTQIAGIYAELEGFHNALFELKEKIRSVIPYEPINEPAQKLLSAATGSVSPTTCPLDGELRNIYERLNDMGQILRSITSSVQL